MSFAETDILRQLDLAHSGTPSEYYPTVRSQDIKYNFFLDLEEGYCKIASSRVHLYADSTKWAIVFETAGYQTRGFDAEISLKYVGNCIDYPVDKFPERNYISNDSRIILIDPDEFKRVENKEGAEMETFELIGHNTQSIKVRDVMIPFESDPKVYEQVGVKIRDFSNPKKLIGFEDLIRYFNETKPSLISATETDIKKHIPSDLPKLMTINEFHFVSQYADDEPPSQQETFQLIAKVLVTNDTTFWKPTLKANNHWTNWESGNL